MIRPNWDIFKVKFSENPQKNFEWFCYLLFCAEFDRPKGVSGYQDQRHIETDPIKDEGETIGWQAKFYQTPLSGHKAEIIELIKGAKRDYPDITKIIFYTNKNWGQGKNQKDPQAKRDIDKAAARIGISLDWEHMENFFSSSFVCIDNELIAKHFFTRERSIFDILEELRTHTVNILDSVRTAIAFNDKTIEIDRKDVLEKLDDGASQVLLLTGTAGGGKTAVIKNLYGKAETPFYVFKAAEFELNTISDLLRGFNLQEFVEVHASKKRKTVVIDSVEKLLDLNNTDPLGEFLTDLIRNSWRIIFTARDNYLDSLNYEFFEIHNISPLKINLSRLEQEYLDSISSEHSFNLPEDRNLLELVRTPFYLNEYLGFYGQDGGGLDYSGFKRKLWNKNIKKSKPSRSEFFLKFAFERAKKGNFFLDSSGESSIADELVKDGMLGYEQDKGYFITHDIYEEWALERKIGREYFRRTSDKRFFENLGQALPVRRSFRSWISERLLLRDSEVENLIESVIADEEIRPFWKDETVISVLLSDYSETLFENLGSSFLRNEQELLRRTCFLLRLACKEIDRDFFKRLGVEKPDLLKLKHILTRPRGHGWKSLIKFVYENIDVIGVRNTDFVLPVIHDWTRNFETGETTKYSGLIALRRYRGSFDEGERRFGCAGADGNHILQTIVFSAAEIRDELKDIFDKILENGWRNHGDSYYSLSEIVLTKPFEAGTIYKVLPESVLKLADLFWTFAPKQTSDPFSGLNMGIGINPYFGIEDRHNTSYHPASPYQTPIYWLLQFALQQTVDFILEFTNKTVERFAKSDLAKHEVEEIAVCIGKDKTKKQYISDRLWCTYRGTQVSPHVLESVHMALEKFFLERGNHIDSKTLESWLLYILEKSESASVSAVVASIVLAYPEKTFNVAKVLFRTKEFFRYDTKRYAHDQYHKTLLSALNFFPDPQSRHFQNERIKACDDKHRKKHLENLFVTYQFFRSEKTSEREGDKRQKALWDILDNYYSELPVEQYQTESDKDWRLCLARMDSRKMKPAAKETEEGIRIDFNPEIDPELMKRSEDAEKHFSRNFEYSALQSWSHYKIENNEACKKYVKYEENPKLALKEVKRLMSRLKSLLPPDHLQHEHTEDEGFFLLNYSIPAKVCSVLVRDYPEAFSEEEISFCKDIVLDVASSSFGMDYRHQIGDGVASAISVLPSVLGKFPGEKKRVKTILLLTLFNPRVAGMARQLFSDYAIMPVLNLWKTNFDDAQSILSGYLLLEPEYEQVRKKLREENFAKEIYEVRESEVVERFLKGNEKEIEKVVSNELPPVELEDMGNLDQFYLRNAFLLIPLEPDNEYQKELARKIIRAFAEKLFSDDSRHGEGEVDYGIKRDFLKRLACLVLSSPRNEIKGYMEPFIHGFKRSKLMADLFEEFVVEEDRLKSYGNFWEVWNLFKEKVIEICRDGDRFSYTKEIAKNFLGAHPWWQESATRWHALKDNDKRFFKEISQRTGHCPSVLYSISKLLDGIGSHYLDDGILWISDTLSSNRELFVAKLEDGTVYHMENSARKYIYKNLQKIRERNELKGKILVLLDFLVEKESVVGYMLRERVI